MDIQKLYLQEKHRLFSIAYGMLDDIQEAENAVQDVFVDIINIGAEPDNIRAYLGKSVSSYDNHNIDIVPDCWTIITTKCTLANGLDCETTAAYCRDCSEGWGQLVDDILFAEVPEI